MCIRDRFWFLLFQSIRLLFPTSSSSFKLLGTRTVIQTVTCDWMTCLFAADSGVHLVPAASKFALKTDMTWSLFVRSQKCYGWVIFTPVLVYVYVVHILFKSRNAYFVASLRRYISTRHQTSASTPHHTVPRQQQRPNPSLAVHVPRLKPHRIQLGRVGRTCPR